MLLFFPVLPVRYVDCEVFIKHKIILVEFDQLSVEKEGYMTASGLYPLGVHRLLKQSRNFLCDWGAAAPAALPL